MVYRMNKRKRTTSRSKRRLYKKSKTARYDARKIRRIANQVVQRNIETKTSQFSVSDGAEIFHNNFITMTNQLLHTLQGDNAPEASMGSRIGDKIKVKGVGLRMMLELNERYSDVTFRIIVVRSARGDDPTRANLFNGESGNKMLDSLNKERYTIIAQKFVKILAPNAGTRGGGVGIPSAGYYEQDTAVPEQILSRATRIVRMWIPGERFARGGHITYENGQNYVKFFDYHVLCYAYSNYSTAQDVYYVGRVNEFLSKMYYKDA